MACGSEGQEAEAEAES
jgi:pilus assembly protein FimV